MLKSVIALIASWSALSSISFAAEKSELLADGSGHYAQILLGDQAIKPIRFKASTIGINTMANCNGLTIKEAPNAGESHVSGSPDTDSCRAVLSIDGQELVLEFFRLPQPPAQAEWPALLATLPKMLDSARVYISSQVPTNTFPNAVWEEYVRVDDEEKARENPSYRKLADVSMIFEPTNQNEFTKYKSCKFKLVNHDLMVTLFADKVGQTANDPVIEACTVGFRGVSDQLTPEEQGKERIMAEYYIVKSYL